MKPSIADNLAHFVDQMHTEAQAIGREPDSIRLVCVSKTFPAAAIREARAAGQREFGENYLQEALNKIRELADLDLVWHFIGQVQSNKAAAIAGHFDWVHAVDREKIARRLSRSRPPGLAPINICLQVNISDEAHKGGITPDTGRMLALAAAVAELPAVRLRGLMAVPSADRAQAEAQFHRMQALHGELQRHFPQADTLSMGMSGDYPLALRYGANLIRIGRAIFGERLYSPAQQRG